MGEMTQDITKASPPDNNNAETSDSLPFPFNQQTFCRYEPVEQHIDQARVLVVDSLLRDEKDLSALARSEWGDLLSGQLKRDRRIPGMAIENSFNNLSSL